jgi:hypothetical protein
MVDQLLFGFFRRAYPRSGVVKIGVIGSWLAVRCENDLLPFHTYQPQQLYRFEEPSASF